MKQRKSILSRKSLQVCVVLMLASWTFVGCNYNHTHNESLVSPPDTTTQQGTQITDCQLLLSEEEIQRQGIARQRSMYPAASKRRLSDQAVRDGFSAATRDEAMREFNRAWRFNPENPMAYWGAAIVRGCDAMRYFNEDRSLSQICQDECIRLFEKGAFFLNNLPEDNRCEYRMDQTTAYLNYAQFLTESKDQAIALLEKAETIILPYYNCHLFGDEGNRRVNVRVSWQLKEIYTLLSRTADAQKFEDEFLKYATEQERQEFESPADGKWGE